MSFFGSIFRWGFSPPKANPLHGHPHKPKRARKIRLHRAQKHNSLIGTGHHPVAAKPLKDPFRRSTGYIKK